FSHRRRPPPPPPFPYTTLFRSSPRLSLPLGQDQSSYLGRWTRHSSSSPVTGERRHRTQPAAWTVRVPSTVTRLPVLVGPAHPGRSEEHTSELQSRENLVCRLLL